MNAKRRPWLLLGVGLALLMGACSPAVTSTPPSTQASSVTQEPVVTSTPAPSATNLPNVVVNPRLTLTVLPSLTPIAANPSEEATANGAEVTPTPVPTTTSGYTWLYFDGNSYQAYPLKPIEHLIELEYPPQIRLGESDIVRLALLPVKDGFVVTTQFEGHEVVTQTVLVVPKEGYELWGVGRLNAVGFELAPNTEQAQLLAPDKASVWQWALQPQSAGQHRLSLALALRWVPVLGRLNTLETDIYSHGFTIQVNSFLGLTAREAMLFGWVAFGVGLIFSLPLAAYTLRGRGPAKQLLQKARPNSALIIEKAMMLSLTPVETTLLQSLFQRYARVVLEAEFRSGYSGARTLLVRPIRADGRADAYTIAKLGERNGLAREFMNYERYVKDTLPPVTARIQDVPVFPQSQRLKNQRRAALRYTFIGAPGASPRSLLQALREDPDPAWLEKLFATFGPNWWMQRKPYTFRLAQEYDRGLPAHYVLKPLPTQLEALRVERLLTTFSRNTLDGRTPPIESEFRAGQVVTLRHWQVVEERPDGQSLSLIGEAQPGHPPLRARWLGLGPPEGAQAEVVATRATLLAELAHDFGPGMADLLEQLRAIENELVSGTQATIHGDLHLENILVGPGGLVWLIDFSHTRDGHTLFDFAHLHASILAQVVSPLYPADADFRAHWATHPLSGALRGLAEQCLFNRAQPREYDLALFMACLAGLKYTNLEATAKRRLFLVAGAVGKNGK